MENLPMEVVEENLVENDAGTEPES